MRTLMALPLMMLPLAFGLQAGQTRSYFYVQTQVVSNCVVSANPLVFGQYDATGEQLNQDLQTSGRITVKCAKGTTSVRVMLDNGENAYQDSNCQNPARRMKSKDDHFLAYQVYQGDQESTWGCDSQGVVVNSFQSSLTPVILTPYAKAIQKQNAPIGSYVDTLRVNVNF